MFTPILLSGLASYKEQFQPNNLFGVLLLSFGGNQFMHLYTGDNYALWYVKLEIFLVLLFPLVTDGRKHLPPLLAALGAAMHYGIEQPCGKRLSTHLKRAFAKIRNIGSACA